jgi:diadenylate cyclase
LVRGVEQILSSTLNDYLRPQRSRLVSESLQALMVLEDSDLEDLAIVGKASGFPELDESAHPRGIRLLGRVGRLPEQVRDELLRHFRSLEGMLAASKSELEEVEGIGAARAAMLRRHFDRWRTTAATWEADPA